MAPKRKFGGVDPPLAGFPIHRDGSSSSSSSGNRGENGEDKGSTGVGALNRMATRSGRSARLALANVENRVEQKASKKQRKAPVQIEGATVSVRGMVGNLEARACGASATTGTSASESSCLRQHVAKGKASSRSSVGSTNSRRLGNASSATVNEVEPVPPPHAPAAAADDGSERQRRLPLVDVGTLREARNAMRLAARAKQREEQERRRRCNFPPPPVDDHDRGDIEDPLACAEYAVDLYQRFKEGEERYSPTCYMHTQTDINGKMRAILIDWIVEVHQKFKLADPTLYLTCHIIDRYCMLENVHRSKLQLVGVTALLIGCKYEEIYPPEVRDCVYITDNAYSRQEVLDMEQTILVRLQFRITVPTTWNFLVRYLKVSDATARQLHRANFFSERALQEHDILSYRPSLVAAACVYLSRLVERSATVPGWPPVMEKYCNMHEDMLLPVSKLILRFLHAQPITASRRKLEAVKKKFSTDEFGKVSDEEVPEGLEGLR